MSLSDNEIRIAVETAFRPLRCVVEVCYDQKLRFRVFDSNDRGVLKMPRLVLRELRDKSNLKSVLSTARATVEEKGFRLEPWAM